MFPLYHWFDFRIFIVQIHRLHCLNDFEMMTVIRGVSELFLFDRYSCFDVYIIIIKFVLIIFCLHCVIYTYFTYQLFQVIRFVFWSTFVMIKGNRVLGNSFQFDNIDVFDQYIIIIKSVLIIYFFHCIIYFPLGFWSFKVISFIVWNFLKR